MAGNSLNDDNPAAALRPPGGHYSHFRKGGGLVFVSGQLPITPDGERLNDASFEAQTQQVLANLTAVLAAAGTSIDQLLQVRVYLDDIEDWPMFDRLYAAWLGPVKPARAVVPTKTLHYGFKVEVEAVAAQT